MSERDQTGGLRVGTVLDGAYRLTRLIFEGGMGTVYEAVQLRLDKRVAVKVMVKELAESAEALARFRREVKVTAHLAHPHVVQLLDHGTAPNGAPYLVTEFLEGEDLEHRLLRVERLSVDNTLQIVRQVASALAVVHAQGIVHRDLKPGNVFLLPIEGVSDFVKVVDFGISKVKTSETKLTRAFTMVGTPEYMSPEQAEGRVDDVDHRSDQWALACMAWRMLAGRAPFVGDHLNQLLERVVRHEPPSLAASAPEVPSAVEKVLRRALSKKQAGRFTTIMAFARAFEAAATGRPVPSTGGHPVVTAAAPPAREGRSPRWVLTLGIVVLSAAAAAAAAYMYRGSLAPLL
jgi:eukaryotic-like serine/threonine-protein kinase